jgi:hypothetical protein
MTFARSASGESIMGRLCPSTCFISLPDFDETVDNKVVRRNQILFIYGPVQRPFCVKIEYNFNIAIKTNRMKYFHITYDNFLVKIYGKGKGKGKAVPVLF